MNSLSLNNTGGRVSAVPDAVGLSIRETRLLSDLRIMHAKVDGLCHIVTSLKHHHTGAAIHEYADESLLAENIQKVEHIYLWFVALKDQLKQK